MGVLTREEMETHVSMSRNSKMMRIYTSEKHIMRRLDKFVEESDAWKLISVGKCRGEIVSKTYEAPRELLYMKKRKRVMTDEQREAASARLKEYWKNKREEETEEESFAIDEDEEAEEKRSESQAAPKPNNKPNSDRLDPQKSKPKYIKDNRHLDDLNR